MAITRYHYQYTLFLHLLLYSISTCLVVITRGNVPVWFAEKTFGRAAEYHGHHGRTTHNAMDTNTYALSPSCIALTPSRIRCASMTESVTGKEMLKTTCASAHKCLYHVQTTPRAHSLCQDGDTYTHVNSITYYSFLLSSSLSFTRKKGVFLTIIISFRVSSA